MSFHVGRFCSFLATGFPSWSGSGLEGGEVGVRLRDGFRVALALLVLSQRPVDAGQARVLAFALTTGDDQIRADVLYRFAVRAAPQDGVQHVLGDHWWAAAVVSLAVGGVEAF